MASCCVVKQWGEEERREKRGKRKTKKRKKKKKGKKGKKKKNKKEKKKGSIHAEYGYSLKLPKRVIASMYRDTWHVDSGPYSVGTHHHFPSPVSIPSLHSVSMLSCSVAYPHTHLNDDKLELFTPVPRAILTPGWRGLEVR